MPVEQIGLIASEPQERWREVVGAPGYWVSDQGRVLSCARDKPRLLKPGSSGKGYRKVNCGRGFSQTVHTMVCEAFIGPRPMTPSKHDVRHRNGIRHDNRLENLSWSTRQDNLADMVEHGTDHRGARHWNSKLSADDVSEMRRRREIGETFREIAEKYEVSTMTAHRAITGASWK